MYVIFLDIDGVLNHGGTRPTTLATEGEPPPLPIAPECMARLNRLVAETGAKIVISASWRLRASWQDLGQVLVRQGLVADVIGGTPDLVNDRIWHEHWITRVGAPFLYEHLERGWEIREWIAHFATNLCSCGHASDLHELGTDLCYHNDYPSGASGCICSHFDASPLTGFVILDDCSDMDELVPWLVRTDPTEGLADPDVERAKWLLGRSTDGILRARVQALGTGAQA